MRLRTVVCWGLLLPPEIWTFAPRSVHLQRASGWPQPPCYQKGEEGWEKEYAAHWGQEVKGMSQAVWWSAGPREPQATRDLRPIILSSSRARPRARQAHARPSLVILVVPSPAWEGQQVPSFHAPLSWHGTANPVCFGNMNRGDKCSWAFALCREHDWKPEINKRLWAKTRSQWQSHYLSKLFMLRRFQSLVSVYAEAGGIMVSQQFFTVFVWHTSLLACF